MKVKYIRSFFEFDWINDEYKLINDLNNLLPSDQYGTLPHKVYDRISKIKKNALFQVARSLQFQYKNDMLNSVKKNRIKKMYIHLFQSDAQVNFKHEK